ncbi:hypothetical protein ACFYLX_08815 [Pseudarthrobacter enclensis]|uniref:hypothetical protein n=1 Tax=Pseudarthrobacter enclensis TaxID=993070 RepID=UPI0036CB0D62
MTDEPFKTSPEAPGLQQDPELLIGLLISPPLMEVLGGDFPSAVQEALMQQHPRAGVRWAVTSAEDRLGDPTAETLELLDAARERMLSKEWDLAVVLTEIPLKDGRRPVLTQLSPLHGVGLVAVPALGARHPRRKAQEVTVEVVGQLLGYDAEDAHGQQTLAVKARQLSTDVEERPDDNSVQFTARVVTGSIRLLLGMIRANRPWAFIVRLSRALVVAAATGVLTLVASDLWLLATAYGPGRLMLLAVMAIVTVSATVILGGGLWERPRSRAEREQVTLFNMATSGTVMIGVLVFFVALFLLSLLGAFLLIDQGVLAAVVGHQVNAVDYVKIGWLTASLATVGGALGAGLEDDNVVRAAAYTRSNA